MGIGSYPYCITPQCAIQRVKDNKKTKRRVNKLVFILAPILLAAIAAVLFIFVIDLRSPEQRVRDAMDNTSEAIEAEQLATEKALGFTGILEQLHGSNTQTDYTIIAALPEGALPGGAAITGPDGSPPSTDSASVSGTLYTDLANGAADLDLGLGLGGTPLINLRLGARGELIAVSSDDLFEGSYGFYQDTFGADYSGSVFAEMSDGGRAPSVDPEASFNIVESLLTLTESAPGSRLYSAQTESALDDLADVLWTAAAVEALDDEDVSVNGVKQSCKVYHVVYERPAFIDYLYAYVDAILADEELDLGMLGTLSSISGTPIPSGGDLEETLYDALESFEEAVSDNIEVTFFIKNDRLLRLDALLFGGDGGSDEISLSVEFGDGEAISNALTFTASQNGEENIRLELSGNQVPKDGVYSRYVTILTPGSAPVDVELWYDTAEDFDNFSFAMLRDGNAVVELGGSLQVNTTQKTLDGDFTQIAMSGAGVQPESVQIGIKPSSHSFESLSPTMLFELDQPAIEAIGQEIVTNAMKTFGGMAGGY